MIAGAKRWSWAAGAPVRLLLIGLIQAYRVTLGQLLGGQCRFYPSCSSYAEAAIRHVGWLRGSLLAIWRVLRCNPFSAGGVDRPPSHQPTKDAVLYDGVSQRVYGNIIRKRQGLRPPRAAVEVEDSGPSNRATRSGTRQS